MTEWNTPQHERTYLRELASKQAEIAALPVMDERRQMWYDLNDGRAGARPPFIIEAWTFDRDFMPDSIFKCQTPEGRGIEAQLLRNIRNHELIDDDKVIPATFGIGWFVDIDAIGVQVKTEKIKDAEGVATGYQFIHPVKDIKKDLHILKPPRCSVDREKTLQWKAYLEDLLGDLLPVEIHSGVFWGCSAHPDGCCTHGHGNVLPGHVRCVGRGSPVDVPFAGQLPGRHALGRR